MSEILPRFMSASFEFDGEAPPHVEEYPPRPNYVGLFAVFGVAEGNDQYPLAVDVPNEETARLLAEARMRHQDATAEVYGYTDDIYIQAPDGEILRTHMGRY